ncbi:MAG: DUF2344 domain-containing protein, partial [bacterium]
AKFSPPLPTGVASEAEYAEIWLTTPLEPSVIFEMLAPKFSTDIALIQVFHLPPPVPKNPWKEVAAARYSLRFAPTDTRAQRQAAVDYLIECRDSAAVPQASLAERRKSRKRQGAVSYSGDEDMMGAGGGGGAPMPLTSSARMLFDEAGDPHDEDATRAPHDPVDIAEAELNRPEHFAKILAVDDPTPFLRGETDAITIIGAYNPSHTLHPMRLALVLQGETHSALIPVATKLAVLKESGGGWVGVW